MPDDLQPGPHLSPDQLSAFAENALPEHEHLAALTHLSACADCRQVVFLAQKADPCLITTPVEETPGRNWFTLPQLFGAATAAFACALILAIIIHLHHDQISPAPPVTTAKLEATPALASPAPTPPPSSQIPEAHHTSNLFKPVEKGSAMEYAPPQPAKIQMAPSPQITSTVGAAMPSGYVTEAKQKDKSNIDYLSATNGTTFAALAPQTAPATFVGAMPAPAAQPAAPTQLEARTRQAYVAGAAPAIATSAEVTSMAQTVDASSIGSLPVNSRNATNYAALTPGVVRPIKLPSKKHVASVLNATGYTLALDADGILFLSNDHGKHWTTVATQWTGKAVQLSFASAPARLYLAQPAQNQTQSQIGNSNTGAITAGVPQQQAAIPTAGFELSTNTGAVWVSTDGLTWHPR